ncbi:MAG: LysM peptidoglycan-binding domain-containing protein [Halanaerobiaceae bacterium]
MKKKVLLLLMVIILVFNISGYTAENPEGINLKDIKIISTSSNDYNTLEANDFNIIGYANLKEETDVLQDVLLRYRVKPGDSLYQIARKFGITVSELTRLNNINSNMLYIGQKILLPGSGEIEEETEEKTGKLIYYVEAGDTLYEISSRFDVSISRLRKENNLGNSYLMPGQMLNIPANVEETRIVYFVKPGDYLQRIAERFDTEIEAIREINELNSGYLSIGQKLLLPEPDYEEKEYNLELEYRVEAGDSLTAIARKYDVSTWELRQHNNIKSVRSGQMINIPLSVPENEMNRQHVGDYNPGKEEMDLLSRAVYSEARGESFEGQVAVAGVVLNRIFSSYFPDTARGVIFQPWQFEAVHDGQFWLKPNQQSRLAVEAALEGWDPSQGALYYYNPDTAQSDWVFYREVIVEIGDHYFALTK